MKQSERPKTNPPLTTLDVVIEALAAVCLIIMFAQLIKVWSSLPDQVPTHFGANGKPDDWGSRSMMLILPMVVLVMYSGLTILSRFPHTFNFPVTITENNFEKQYKMAKTLLSFVKLSVIGIFLYIQVFTIRTAQGESAGLGVPFLIFTIVGTFIPIMVYMILALRTK